jgi:hypothetical protein
VKCYSAWNMLASKVAEVGGGEEQLGGDVTSRCNASLYGRSVGVSVCVKWTLRSGARQKVCTHEKVDYLVPLMMGKSMAPC